MIQEILTQDHGRLDQLLVAARAGDVSAYEAFREGLLRHIGMEEKILLPAARRASLELPMKPQLKADHAVLAALLVPTPTDEILGRIATVLTAHNPLEEGPDGLYALCDRLEEAPALIERLRAAPAVPVAPHFDGERAFAGIERLWRAAGYR